MSKRQVVSVRTLLHTGFSMSHTVLYLVIQWSGISYCKTKTLLPYDIYGHAGIICSINLLKPSCNMFDVISQTAQSYLSPFFLGSKQSQY